MRDNVFCGNSQCKSCKNEQCEISQHICKKWVASNNPEILQQMKDEIHKGDFILLHKGLFEKSMCLYYVLDKDDTGISIAIPIFKDLNYHFTWKDSCVEHYRWEFFQACPYEICTDKIPTKEMERLNINFNDALSKLTRNILAGLGLILAGITGLLLLCRVPLIVAILFELIALEGFLLVFLIAKDKLGKIYVNYASRKLKTEKQEYSTVALKTVRAFREYKNKKHFDVYYSEAFNCDVEDLLQLGGHKA